MLIAVQHHKGGVGLVAELVDAAVACLVNEALELEPAGDRVELAAVARG